MARWLTKLLSWLAGKVVVYAVILGLLLAIFLLRFLPSIVVNHHEAQLQKAVAELSESRALVGELAAQGEQLSREMDQRRKQLRELEAKRKDLDALIQKFLNLFRRDEVIAERKRIAAEQRELRKEIGEFSKAKRELRVQGGENEEELARREVLRDEKQRQLRETQQLKESMDNLMQNQFRKLAIDALWILAALIILPLVWKLLAYYVVAALVQRSSPILLGVDALQGEPIEVTSSPSCTTTATAARRGVINASGLFAGLDGGI